MALGGLTWPFVGVVSALGKGRAEKDMGEDTYLLTQKKREPPLPFRPDAALAFGFMCMNMSHGCGFAWSHCHNRPNGDEHRLLQLTLCPRHSHPA